jgi:predicted nucleic acid-binding protein
VTEVRSFVVDTGVFGASLGADPLGLVKLYEAELTGARLVISFQTVAELRYGALSSHWGARRTAEMEARIRLAVTIPPHDDLATEWARLRDECRRHGHGLQDKKHSGDLWIAATARLLGLTLVSHDRVHLGTPGLTVICRA